MLDLTWLDRLHFILGRPQCNRRFQRQFALDTSFLHAWRYLFVRISFKLNLYFFPITLWHAHLCFWSQKPLFDKSISKRYPKCDAASKVEKSCNFKSISHSWHMILLVVWKPRAWVFVAEWWRGVWIENAAAHCSALKNAQPSSLNPA